MAKAAPKVVGPKAEEPREAAPKAAVASLAAGAVAPVAVARRATRGPSRLVTLARPLDTPPVAAGRAVEVPVVAARAVAAAPPELAGAGQVRTLAAGERRLAAAGRILRRRAVRGRAQRAVREGALRTREARPHPRARIRHRLLLRRVAFRQALVRPVRRQDLAARGGTPRHHRKVMCQERRQLHTCPVPRRLALAHRAQSFVNRSVRTSCDWCKTSSRRSTRRSSGSRRREQSLQRRDEGRGGNRPDPDAHHRRWARFVTRPCWIALVRERRPSERAGRTAVPTTASSI